MKGTLARILASASVLLGGCDRTPRWPHEVAPAGAPGPGLAVAARPPAGPRLPRFDGFEAETVADFWLPGNYGSGLYVPGAVAPSEDHARTGSRSVRITVKAGDIAQPGEDGVATERAELDSGHVPALGRDVWYGFSFLIPPGFPVVDDRLVLSSCKQKDVGKPLVAQRYRKGRHELTVWEPGPDGGSNRHYPLPPLRPGRWNDLILHVRYSAGDDGLVEAWVGGVRAVTHAGPTARGDAEDRFYHKIGLYRDRWKDPMTAHFDNYTMGDSYGAVDPARFDRPK